MSAHVFCPSCGSKNDYLNGKKPNFCTSCGHNFQSLAVFGGGQTPAPKPTRQSESRMDVTIDGRDDEGNYSEEEGSISRADVEINVETKNKVTVGSIVGTAQAGTNDARHAMDTKLKRHSTKDAFVKFKEEAGANGLKRTEIG